MELAAGQALGRKSCWALVCVGYVWHGRPPAATHASLALHEKAVNLNLDSFDILYLTRFYILVKKVPK